MQISSGIYRREVTEGQGGGNGDVASYVTRIATRLNQQVRQVSSTIRVTLEDLIPELRGDARTMELMSAAVEDNVAVVLHMLRHAIPAEQTTVPQSGVEYSKRLAQNGVPLNALVRGYRLGQRRMTDLVFAELDAMDMEPVTRVAVIEAITTAVLEYVEWVAQQVVAAYENEQEQWQKKQNTRRAMRVRDILAAGASVDVDAVSEAIHYPLRWQHLALIAWYPGDEAKGDEQARLQRFVGELAAAVGTSAGPLFAAPDGTSGWIWLPYRSAPGDLIVKVREFVYARTDVVNIAVGAVGSGVDGFRRSHRQAQRVRSAVLARGERHTAVVAATDPGMVAAALLGTSVDEVREWVADVLGPLASNTDDDASLRETLRLFLGAGSGYHEAAKELSLNFEALRNRVERAVARRGRPIDDRLDVELALLVCHRYGEPVLRPR